MITCGGRNDQRRYPRQRPPDQPVKRLILGDHDFQVSAIDCQQDLRSPRHGNGFRNVRCRFAKGVADVDETVTSLNLVCRGRRRIVHTSPLPVVVMVSLPCFTPFTLTSASATSLISDTLPFTTNTSRQ